MYNFAKFIEWPNPATLKAVTICVYGKDPFGGFLDEAVRGKEVHGLPIVLRRLPAGDDGWAGCQVLFVGLSKTAQVETLLVQMKGRSILTVGESAGFANSGGMIGLTVDGGRVRFDINLTSVAAAHLKASAQIIEIGRVVRSPN